MLSGPVDSGAKCGMCDFGNGGGVVNNEFDVLMRFYGVDTIEDLVRAQELHIQRLQDAVSRRTINQVLASSPVRIA